MKKVLILTAGYGDGHNSAARGVAEAFAERSDCKVVDVIALAEPFVFKYSRLGYLWMIAHAPALWRLTYDWTNGIDMSKGSLAGMGKIFKCLERLLAEYEPDLIVSTYMVYPYMLDRIFESGDKRIPYVTVVTDSLEINKSWICSHSGAWLVTDRWTRQVMIDRGMDGRKIVPLGFPVSPRLAALAAKGGADWRQEMPFRVLYFPQGNGRRVTDVLSALLESHPGVTVTCVLGRHFRKYYKRLGPLKLHYGERLKIRGWTKKVPEFMSTHHLVVSKAGGAITHECIAMGLPMLVNFKTPGQEEGNIELLERLGGGRFVETAADLREMLVKLLANDAILWRAMRGFLVSANMRDGAGKIVSWCRKNCKLVREKHM